MCSRKTVIIFCSAVLSLVSIARFSSATSPSQQNLALNMPATASSIENDDQNAAKANDGDDATHWCADDEPESGAEWWQVDLEKPTDLAGCELTFPYDDKQYRYKVEGSADCQTWTMLSDQSQTVSRQRIQNLTFSHAGTHAGTHAATHAAKIRFVRITITAFDKGCWASIAEVKVFGGTEK